MAGIRADISLDVNTSQVKRSLDKATNEINRVMKNIGGKQVSFNVNGRSFTQPLGRITASANEFTKSLEASNARVIAFGASVGIINGISDAFKALVRETIAFEKTLTDINVVLGASNQQLEKFGKGIFDVARNTSQGFNIAAEAALEFSRQGLSMEKVLSRTNDALILTRLTGLKAADAVSGLTAAVNAFASAGLTTTDIIDKLAAVDVKFAVSSEDLINALERTGAVAIDAGVGIDSLIGLVTALQQTTARGGSVIGNGLKTIFTRIQRPQSINQLESMGIAVKNLKGEILGADKILLNMAKSFSTLSQSQQSNIVQFSAGIFQANVFRAALRDLSKEQSIQAEATRVSADASGQAADKNEILNKTMAAMASQTATSIQELAEVMGKLMLTPEIGDFLSFVKDSVDGIKNLLGGGEEDGSTFAKGLVRGIGNVLTGPAAIAFGAIFIKLFVNISKFASSSLKDVLGIVSQKEKIRQMEESILQVLSENMNIQQGLNNLEGDRKAQEQFILGIIEKQNQAMRQQAALAAQLAKPLIRSGVNPDFSKKASRGLIPEEKRQERKGAAKGGYSAGGIDSMDVPGIGKVVYNKAETVKQFPGMKQPAIMPPEKSRAGGKYKNQFVDKHGFDPYAYGGFIPNYALKARRVGDTNILRLPKAKMMVETSAKQNLGGNRLGGKVTGWKTLEARVEALQAKGMGWYKDSLEDLKSLGIDVIQRPFYFTNIDHQKKASKKASRAQSKIPRKGFIIGSDGKKMTKSDVGGSVFEDALLKSSHQSILKDRKYKSTKLLKGATVDFISKGRLPIEAKHGSKDFQENSLMAKSLRLTGDKYIEQFLMSHGKESSAASMAETKMKESMNILEKNKIKPSEEAVRLYRLSHGLIPNFAKERQQKVKLITSIKDGDSVAADVYIGQKEIDHRLHGVDAAEKDQPFGNQATAVAERLYGRGGVRRLDRSRDAAGKAAYNRGLFADEELSEELVVKGYGVPDRRYMNQREYGDYQDLAEFAKKRGVGIWGKNYKVNKGTKANPDMHYTHNKAIMYLKQNALFSQGERKKKNLRIDEAHKAQARFSSKRLSEGLIPNYADFRTRQQKIQDVLKDPANKGIKFRGSKLGTMSIKSKNMFHQMFLESYVNKGLKSDYDMLVEMGYDPKKIQAARKHKQKGGRVNVMSGGLIPNFANPLSEAIKREYGSGVPKSQIRIERDDSLMSRANPMGLAITNTRDEPMGVKQGIRRAKQMGIDPKNHGASEGFVPNFQFMSKNYAKGGQVQTNVPTSLKENSDAIKENTAQNNANNEAMGGGLMKLFALQSAISMVNGPLEEMAKNGSGVSKTFGELGLASSNVIASMVQSNMLLGELSSSFGVKRSRSTSLIGEGSIFTKKGRAKAGGSIGSIARGGKAAASSLIPKRMGGAGFGALSKGLGMVGKGFLRFVPIIGQLYTGFTILNEGLKFFTGEGVLDRFQSEAEKSADRLEKLAASAETAKNALETTEDLSQKSEEISRLEALGHRRSVKQDKELNNLRVSQIELTAKQSKGIQELDVSNIGSKKLIEDVNKLKAGETQSLKESIEILGRLNRERSRQESSEKITGILAKNLEGKDLTQKVFQTDQGNIKASDNLFTLIRQMRGARVQGVKSKQVLNEDVIPFLRNAGISQAQIKFSRFQEQSKGDDSKRDKLVKEEIGRLNSLKGKGLLDFAKKRGVEDPTKEVARIIRDAEARSLGKQGKDQQNRTEETQANQAYLREANELLFNTQQRIKNDKITLKTQIEGLKTDNEIKNIKHKILSENKAISEQLNIEKNFTRQRINIQNDSKQKKEDLSGEFNSKLMSKFNSDLKKSDMVNTLLGNIKSGKTKTKSSKLNELVEKFGIRLGNDANYQLKEFTKIFTESSIKEKIQILESGIESSEDATGENALKLKDLLNSYTRSKVLLEKDEDNQLLLNRRKEAQALIAAKTVEGAKKLQDMLEKGLPFAQAQIENMRGVAATLKVANDFMEKGLRSVIESQALQDVAKETQREKNATEAQSSSQALAALKAQQTTLRDTYAYKTIIKNKVETEFINADLARDESNERLRQLSDQKVRSKLVGNQLIKEVYDMKSAALLSIEKVQQLSQEEKLTDYVTIQVQKQVADLGLSTLISAKNTLILTGKSKEAELILQSNRLQESSNKLQEAKNAIDAALLSDKERRTNVGAGIISEKATSVSDAKNAATRALIDPSSENLLNYATKLEETNRLFGNGSRVMDRLRVKMAELNVSSENLSSDLVSTGIEEARSGMKQMFKDIGSGAKRASEAFEDLAMGIAQKVLDRVMEHNIDNIIKNLTFAFTGEDGAPTEEKIHSEMVSLNEKAEGLKGPLDNIKAAVERQTNELKFELQKLGLNLALGGGVSGLFEPYSVGGGDSTGGISNFSRIGADGRPNPNYTPASADVESRLRKLDGSFDPETGRSALGDAIGVQGARVAYISSAGVNKGERDFAESLNSSLPPVASAADSTASSLNSMSTSLEQFNSTLANATSAVSTSIPSSPIESLTSSLPDLPSAPDIIENYFGGKIQKFAKGGFVEGPAGVDKVPAMLTAGEYVVPRKDVQRFSEGGVAELNNPKSQNRLVRGTQGVTQMLVMGAVAKAMSRTKNNTLENPPTFDENKLKNLDLKSDVNLSRRDPRLSSRFIANDPVMAEYSDYLIQKSAYEAAKKNDKVEKRKQTVASIMGVVASTALSFAISKVTPYIQKGMESGKKAFKNARDYSRRRGSMGKEIANDFTGEVNSAPLKIGSDKDPSNVVGGINVANANALRAYHAPINPSAPSGSSSFGDFEDYDLPKPTSGLKYQSGGQVPAMLTAGEGFIPASVAKKIGYGNLDHMNKTGELPVIQGKGGIDNVGPVGLGEGDFIIRKSSTDKLLKSNPNTMRFAMQNPEGFKKGEYGYYEGGIVGTGSKSSYPSISPSSRSNSSSANLSRSESSAAPQSSQASSGAQSGAITNNISVNVKIDQSGSESISSEGENQSYEKERDLSLKIKTAVIDVIRQEKRIGGELS